MTPTFTLQSSDSDCGSAALYMVLTTYGVVTTARAVDTACDIGADGCTAADIVRAAAQFGITSRGRRVPADALHTLTAPMIVARDQHFVVVESATVTDVRIADPARGRRTMSVSDFARGYGGVALTFTRAPGAAPAPSTQTGVRDSAAALSQAAGIGPVRVAVLMFGGFACAAAVVELAAALDRRALLVALVAASAVGMLTMALRWSTTAAASVWSGRVLAGWLDRPAAYSVTAATGRARQHAAASAGLHDRVSDGLVAGAAAIALAGAALEHDHRAGALVLAAAGLVAFLTATSARTSENAQASVAHAMSARLALVASGTPIDRADVEAANAADADARRAADRPADRTGGASTAVVVFTFAALAHVPNAFALTVAPFLLVFVRRAVIQTYRVAALRRLMAAFGPTSHSPPLPNRPSTAGPLELQAVGCSIVDTALLSATVQCGQVHDIVGPGARTMVDSLFTGVSARGRISVGYNALRSISDHPRAVALRSEPTLFDGSVADNVSLFGAAKFDWVTDRFELDRIGPDTPVADLGPLDRRLVALARCAALGTSAVLMDEPYAGLNCEQRVRLRKAMRDVGAPVVTASTVGAPSGGTPW